MGWRRGHIRLSFLFTVGVVLAMASTVFGMKKDDFKTCSQSGFCKRNRAYADMVTNSATKFESPYTLLLNTVEYDKSHVYADIENTDSNILLTLDLYVLDDNTARVRVNEKQPIKPRYDEHTKYTLVDEPLSKEAESVTSNNEGVTVVIDATRKIVIQSHPVRIDFIVNDSPVISLNDRGLFNFEHLRLKEDHKPKMIQEEDGEKEAPWESDMWEETFKTWTDPKPNGPESIALDITFHDFPHVYGIPVSFVMIVVNVIFIMLL